MTDHIDFDDFITEVPDSALNNTRTEVTGIVIEECAKSGGGDVSAKATAHPLRERHGAPTAGSPSDGKD